jgi:hypothetical protein
MMQQAKVRIERWRGHHNTLRPRHIRRSALTASSGGRHTFATGGDQLLRLSSGASGNGFVASWLSLQFRVLTAVSASASLTEASAS